MNVILKRPIFPACQPSIKLLQTYGTNYQYGGIILSIQVLKPKYHVDKCLDQIRECLEVGWTGMGFKTVEFEEAWCKYTGHKHSHYLNSATAGLNLAVEILKKENHWADDDEVITTPITFVSTNHAILLGNMKPCFADVDEYLCLDPVDVEKKITERTRAVMFVGYGGRIGRLAEILEICKRHKLKLILDAAHMAGTRVNGITPGVWEGIDVAVYSYQAVKNLPTADSGMICFQHKEYDAICRKMTWLGINKDTYARSGSEGNYKWKYDVEYVGYKDHGNSIMAAIGLAELPYLDEGNAYRRMLSEIYDVELSRIPKIEIIGAPHKEECSFHIYEIALENRDGLMDFLALNDVYCGVHYRDNIEYSMFSYAEGTCPNARRMSNNIVTLPLHLWLSEEDVRHICVLIKEYTGQAFSQST